MQLLLFAVLFKKARAGDDSGQNQQLILLVTGALLNHDAGSVVLVCLNAE